MAHRLPHVVASNISLLAPHLGGKAYPIRSAIVTAIGHLIQRAFGPTAEGADAQGMPCIQQPGSNMCFYFLCLPLIITDSNTGVCASCNHVTSHELPPYLVYGSQMPALYSLQHLLAIVRPEDCFWCQPITWHATLCLCHRHKRSAALQAAAATHLGGEDPGSECLHPG